MASIIEGYSYDIFISYRQKDNKYDGWVTEFVDNLKKELEATFKEEVTVYYDINPFDGLLETYDVDASLKEKLKCLLLIPIISRTYCDPKSFAWEHEFKAFVEQASHDQFGIKVKLPNGNIANRVLPVRIHDLDINDIKLCESIIGSVLRGVEFIYKEPGVNRPLRSNEDNPHDNLNHTIYRNQINKVANAINEIIISLKKIQDAPAGKVIPSGKPEEVKLDKKKINLEIKAQKKSISPLQRSAIWVTVSIILLICIFLGIKWNHKQKKIEWAKQVQIPAIQKLANDNFTPPTKAFDMALEIETIIPNDTNLKLLWRKISTTFPLETQPAGAKVYWKDYDSINQDWRYVGTTPIRNARFPLGYLRIKIEKQGFQTIFYAGPDYDAGSYYGSLGSDIAWLWLDSIGTLPENMVRIPSKATRLNIVGMRQDRETKVGEFLADRFEVTNKDFKRFVDVGGYSNKKFWKYPIYINGIEIPWTESIKLFVDKTGRPGPSTWEAGTFPEGTENYPVAGVSWYEAVAYAEYVNKKIPNVFQWSVIASTNRTMNIVPLSNFNNTSLVQVGNTEGISSFGIYDIAGNVREWCFNAGNLPYERYTLGGGWNDPTYSFNQPGTQLAVDRSISNGFRCIKQLPGDTTIEKYSGRIYPVFRDYRKEKPVDDKTFNIYLRQFDYDKNPLNSQVSILQTNNLWKCEKVTLDAAYNKEKLIIYIFLPKEFSPPFQPVIYFPGANAIISKDISDYFPRFDFIVKSGRALIFPIYKGTYERKDELKSDKQQPTVFYKDHVIMWRKDIGCTIDYLKTRSDIQTDKVGYFGWSWGGFMGGIIPAVENRIKAVVLHVGGMQMTKTFQEVDQLNYLPRIHQPLLMLNGKHDMFYPLETSQKPMFDLIGSKIKELKVYNAGHLVPRQDIIKETLIWYDKYLGPVK